MENKKITVVGSINMDLVTSTKRVPVLGETVLGESFHTIPGGKGANQAVAAARLGADTTLIGCVGDDTFGKDLLKHLASQGIRTPYVKPITYSTTGIASITISNGENHIIVVPGANFQVTPEYVAEHEDVIASSDILLLQLEIPIESVEKAVELAKKHGVKVILNPAPIQPLSKDLMKKVDYFTPNEYEQQVLLESHEWTNEEREELLAKCIITKGSKGITFTSGGKVIEIPSYKVEVVDTTGAGDSFNGGLAYALNKGIAMVEACKFANAVAALSVTKLGAQSGMPTLAEVEEFLQTRDEAK
ncbi:ribokinase [Bacillus sp. BRMEA1]|uniref:ribokinase n=1 Tax=Neobacillus endophyticus TaxID=2738405 RepID=UPI0015658227|nr:ribokinase [Neobacillus endophyticus]NRD76902.1 ribokinase [Neobacillus endophyticus]